MTELKSIITEIDEHIQYEEMKKSVIIEMFDVRERISRSLEWDRSQLENNPENSFYNEDLKCEEMRLKIFDTIAPKIVEFIKSI